MLPGAFLINGIDPSTGTNTTFSYDVAANAWSMTPDFPFPVQYPFIIAHGGWIVQMTGNAATPNQMAFISSSSVSSAWTTATLTGVVPLRVGQRYISWGGIVYMHGGYSADGVYQNDMYAIDMDGVISNPTAPPAWVQVTANSSGAFPPLVPPARALHSFDPYGHIATLYGGVSAAPGVSPFSCVATGPNKPDPSCFFHQSVWIFMPGQSVSPAPGIHQITPAAWTWTQPSGLEGGPVPAGRFGHASGHYGDLLYVFGGFTSSGVDNSLWTFVLPLRQWIPVQQVAPWPATGFGNARAEFGGIVIGRHLYVYLSAGPSVNQLWRWSHNVAITPSSSGANAPVFPPHPGTVAGLTIAILVGLVNMAGVYIIWRRGKGVNPASASVPIPDVYAALPQGM
jgi:hypothetical protein